MHVSRYRFGGLLRRWAARIPLHLAIVLCALIAVAIHSRRLVAQGLDLEAGPVVRALRFDRSIGARGATLTGARASVHLLGHVSADVEFLGGHTTLDPAQALATVRVRSVRTMLLAGRVTYEHPLGPATSVRASAGVTHLGFQGVRLAPASTVGPEVASALVHRITPWLGLRLDGTLTRSFAIDPQGPRATWMPGLSLGAFVRFCAMPRLEEDQ